MTDNENSLSFGRYLKTIRLEKGIDLKEVSRQTKITVDCLLKVENEKHDELPAEVFVKGFIRAYAKVVNADTGKAVELYLSSLNLFRGASGSGSKLTGSKLTGSGVKSWTRLQLSLGILLCIILAVVVIIIFQHRSSNDVNLIEQSSKAEPKAEPKAEIDAKPKAKIDAKAKAEPKAEIDQDSPALLPGTFKDPDSATKHPENISEKLSLKIISVENTWIKIIIDGQKPKEYSLHPEDRLEFEASSAFNILIGNAKGVKLILNDKPVKIPGKSGQVVNIKIP